MDCKRYSPASRHEVLLDGDEFRSFSQVLELGYVLHPSQLSVTVLVLRNQFCVPLFDPPIRVSPYLFHHFQHVWVSKRNVLWIRVWIRVSPYSLTL